MFACRRVIAVCLVIVSLLVTTSVQAGIAPENVIVVVNGDSETSQRIAQEYVRLRDIPANHIVSLFGLKDREKMSVEDFRTVILGPVLAAIEERRLGSQIDLIAYSSEIPTAIDVSGDLGGNKLPRIFTPIASINGLTFLHQLVMAKNPAYLALNCNFYTRRVVVPMADQAWSENEQRRYATALLKRQQQIQSQAEKKDKEPTDDERQQAVTLLKEVVAVFDELLTAHPQSAELNYNRACILAVLGENDAAITALKAAVKSGWYDDRHAARDEDLKGLRNRDDFKAALDDMKKVDFDVQPSVGFRATINWSPTGAITNDEKAPRYYLSTVLACTTGRGTSVDEAIAQLQRTAAADGTRPSGTIYFERNGDVRSTTREWAFRNAARQLEKLGVKAIIEDGVLPKDRKDVAGAVIGIADFDWNKSGSTVLPGAIVEHLTSFGGVMTKGAGQTPLTEFLKAGAAGASGTVTEPFAIQAKFPSPFIHCHYANGCTLAEAFYQSVAGPYQLLIVGDPLCQPWRKHLSVSIPNLANDANVSGELELVPQVESRDNISAATLEFYVDGVRIITINANQPLKWKTQNHRNGEHVLAVIVRGNDAVQTVDRYRAKVVISN